MQSNLYSFHMAYLGVYLNTKVNLMFQMILLLLLVVVVVIVVAVVVVNINE